MGTEAQRSSVTSLPKSSALPDSWVARIFERMEDRYGDLWATRYGAFPRDRVMRTWAEDLADLSRDELAQGVAACRDQKFPPTLPEFRALCRPPIDYQSALLEAVEQMGCRASGADRWSHPAIYWAAVKIGAYDLSRLTLKELETRWRKEFGEQMALGKWLDIPVRHEALPAPGQTHSRDVGSETLQAMLRRLKGEADAHCREADRNEP